MGFAAKDHIDRALLKKYSRAHVDNPSLANCVDPNKMLETLNDCAYMQQTFVRLNLKVQTVQKNITDIQKHKYVARSFSLSC